MEKVGAPGRSKGSSRGIERTTVVMASDVTGAEWRFRPRLWPTLAALAGVLALLALGYWQLERRAWKEGLIAQRTARLSEPLATLPATADDWRVWDLRPVRTEGRFRHDLEQLYGVEKLHERLGHHVLTPLIRPAGAAVLVDRGWVPADRVHPATRRAGQTEGEVVVTGIARHRADDRPGLFTPANEPANARWYGYDMDAMQAALGLELLPIVVEADDRPNPGGLPEGGQTRVALPNDHLSYAITWFGLAAGLAVIYVLFSLRAQERSP